MKKSDLRKFTQPAPVGDITVWHDLPETPGLSIGDAYIVWGFKTNGDLTSASFAAYINSKREKGFHDNYAFTQEEYDKLPE